MLRAAVRPSVVYLADGFVDPDEARVRVDDRGYLLGDGVFATLRGHRGVCFRSQDHLARLARGADLFGLALPAPIPRLTAIANEAAARTEAVDAYVRVTLTRTDGGGSTLTILARPLDVPSAAERASGIRATVVTTRRPPPSCADPFVKTTSYAGAVLARREATTRGFDEGLQLAVDGTLACGAMANVFAVVGDRVVTPPLASGCRAGVTRALVLELAAAAGMTVGEEPVTSDALAGAREVFLTSTRIGCLPVREVDGARFGERFPVTGGLHAALEACVASECAR